jgi:hypothetical protein
LSVLNDREASQHRAPRGIGGWLILLLLDLWIIAAVRLASGVSTLLTLFRGVRAPMVPAAHGPLPAAVSILAGVTGAVTGFLLARKNTKGPTVAKILFFLEIGYYLASLFIALLSTAPAVVDSLPAWAKPAGYLLSSVLCLGYLFGSRRIANTYSGEPEPEPDPVLEAPDVSRLRVGAWEEFSPPAQPNCPAPEPETDLEPEFEREPDFIPEPKIDLALRLGFKSDHEPNLQDARLVPEPEFKLEPLTQLESEPKFTAEPAVPPEPEPTLIFEPEFKSGPELNSELTREIEPEPEPEPEEPELSFELESEVEPESELETVPEPELDLITLKARVAAGVTQWLSSSTQTAHAAFLRDAGASTNPEKFNRKLLDQVYAICDHAWSVHTGESPTLPNTPDSNGSITHELQKWAIAQAASKLTRCLDIRAAMQANGPFENMVEDRDYILAIVEKNASGDGFDRRMELEKHARHSGPEIVSHLIHQAQRDMFEAELWAQVATLAGDPDFLQRFEEAGSKAFQSSSRHWQNYVARVREQRGHLRPVGV